jgi:hypothetical protein
MDSISECRLDGDFGCDMGVDVGTDFGVAVGHAHGHGHRAVGATTAIAAPVPGPIIGTPQPLEHEMSLGMDPELECDPIDQGAIGTWYHGDYYHRTGAFGGDQG